MNEKKVCFIACVNNKEEYNEALYYINNLEIPEGYTIECISVENAKSMTHGYNEAMKQTDAKYKVYLHQDTYIINKRFIYDILEIFNTDDKIGLIGVIGAKKMPTNGIWWDSKNRIGKVYESHTGKMDLLSFDDFEETYCEAEVVDGLLMATQYDISWREDIFDGWHYYDASQCVEFIKSGYKVVISKQDKPWVQHDCGIVNIKNGFEYYRNIFLDEYSTYLYPLVSVLIPTYNRPHYFKEALDSVINQTYRNIEIIIGDDSTNNETEELVRNQYLYKYPNIKYYHNEKNLGQFENDIKLMNMAKGDYVNFLMDDDLFAPQKIEKMMNYFIFDEKDEISLISSYRIMIDEKGNRLIDNVATQKLFETDVVVDGEVLILLCIKNLTNFIGEPTTVLFKKKFLKGYFGTYENKTYLNINDLVTWANISHKRKIVYISECLSFFRQHSMQNSNNRTIYFTGIYEWKIFTDDCYKNGLINSLEDYKNYLMNWLRVSINIISNTPVEVIDNNLKSKIKCEFQKVVETIL